MAKRRGASQWLGSVDIDSPGITIHHCKVCNTTWEHRVDEAGSIYRREVKEQIHHIADRSVIDLG
jgi:hypothetical protein